MTEEEKKANELKANNYEANNIINNYIEERQAIIKILKEFKTDLKKYQEQGFNHTAIPAGAIGVRINAILKIMGVE